jgi:hypothetical protein
MFFFEQRNQKTFALSFLRRADRHCACCCVGGSKGFLLLFLKKKTVLPYDFTLT